MRVIKSNRFALLVFVVAVCAQSVLCQNDAKQKDLPKLYRVNDGLYRGGQPTEAGLKQLVQLRIKTIVNLRDNDDRASVEGAATVAAGLRYFNLPLSDFHKPNDQEVAHILSIINAPENQPVFVHCKRGADRTGTIIAIYRIEHDGWTDHQAKQEAERFGLGFWQLRMKDYISDYYHRKLTKSEGNTPVPQLKLR
jgi:protein tyrosine/serine phosphatase